VSPRRSPSVDQSGDAAREGSGERRASVRHGKQSEGKKRGGRSCGVHHYCDERGWEKT